MKRLDGSSEGFPCWEVSTHIAGINRERERLGNLERDTVFPLPGQVLATLLGSRVCEYQPSVCTGPAELGNDLELDRLRQERDPEYKEGSRGLRVFPILKGATVQCGNQWG